MIHFNIPPFVGTENKYIEDAIKNHKICGDGKYTKMCNHWFEEKFDAQKVLLTTSGTTALDMAMLLCDLKQGDEVILPSYTFSSTATAAVLAGAKLVFVDIRPDTMNIDENKLESAITDKSKAIIVMHYAGVSCEMNKIMEIAHKYNLLVIEDAAQGVMSTYCDRYLGTIGDFGCFSFHETKNFTMGEGGALVINNEKYNERAEILREKGTNRAKFFRGQVDKYTWVDFGDSYLPSELNAAYLWAQLEEANMITNNRLDTWLKYNDILKPYVSEELIDIQTIPKECVHNAHMYYIKLSNIEERTKFIDYMKRNDILSVFHYVPLHSSPAGLKYGRFSGKDVYTTKESERLVRLPLYYNIDEKDFNKISNKIIRYFEKYEKNIY